MIDRLLFDRFRLSVHSQAVFRILYASLLIGMRQLSADAGIAAVHPDLYYPPLGPLQFLPIPKRLVIVSTNAVATALAFLLLCGFRTRIVSLVLALVLMLANGWDYCAGKVDHHVLFMLLPVCLAFSRWGDAFSIDAARHNRPAKDACDADAWPFALLAILVAVGMFGSGVQKILGGWLDPGTSATLGWIVYLGEGWGRTPAGVRHIELLLSLPRVLRESLDALPIAFEVLFPLGLLNRRLFQFFCCIALLFHFGTFVLLGIYFVNQAIVYAAFFDWRYLWNSLPRVRLPGWVVAGAELCAAIVFIIWLFIRPLPAQSTVFIGVSTALAVLGLIALAVVHFRRKHDSNDSTV